MCASGSASALTEVILSEEGGDSEDVWGEFMEVEDETQSRKKLDEQKKQLQNEPRDVDRLSFVSKEMQESIKESLQHQLQEVEKRRHDLMPEHQKAQKKSQKIQSIQDKRKICRWTVSQQKRRCGSSKWRSGKSPTKSMKIRCAGCRNGGRASEVTGGRKKRP